MIANLAEVMRGHEHFLAQNERLVNDALATAGRHAVQHVQQHATFKRRTGKLQDKTQASNVVRTRGGKLIRVFNPLRYAASIDSGSKPHVIRPSAARGFIGPLQDGQSRRGRGRKFLRFQVAGRWVFARKVNHPGTKPYKFLYRATHSAHRVMGDYLRREATQIAKRF